MHTQQLLQLHKPLSHTRHTQHTQLIPQVGLSPKVDSRLLALRDVLGEELATCSALMEVQGALEPLLAAGLIAGAGAAGVRA